MLTNFINKSSLYTKITLAISGLLLGCGEKEGKTTSEPINKAVKKNGIADASKPIPTITATPLPPTVAKNFWMAHSNSYIIQSYNILGQTIKQCDLTTAPFLKSLHTGGITALSFFDAKTLLALVDPGTTGEQIVAIDVSNDACTISPWYEANSSFEDVTSNSMMPVIYSDRDYARVFVARSNGIDRFTWNKTTTPATRAGATATPFIPINPTGIATCVGGSITNILTLGDGDNKILLVSTIGEGVQRLNLIGSLLGGSTGNPQCLSSLNYTASGQPTTSADIPVQAVTLSDKRIYVLYKNPTDGAKLVRYDFNGTQLLAPFLLSRDQDDLGFTPTAMAGLTNKNIIIANGRSLAVLDTTSGRLVRPLENEKFDSTISAMTSEL